MDNQEVGKDQVKQEIESKINKLLADYKKLKESTSQMKDKGPGMVKLQARANEILSDIKQNFSSGIGLTNEGVSLNRQILVTSDEIDADVASINLETSPSDENRQNYSKAIDALRAASGREPLRS